MELFRRNPVQSSSVIIAKNEMVVFVETLSNEEVLNLAVRGMMSSEPTVQRKVSGVVGGKGGCLMDISGKYIHSIFNIMA
ncbi:hypothetical protein ACLKA6_002097 [Drosophila palustris]